MGRLDYNKIWEHCQYGWKEGASRYFARDPKLTTLLQNDLEKLSKEELLQLIASTSNAIYVDKPSKSKLHPTMKPVELF